MSVDRMKKRIVLELSEGEGWNATFEGKDYTIVDVRRAQRALEYGFKQWKIKERENGGRERSEHAG